MNEYWTDVLSLGLRGRGWTDEPREQPFDRLPQSDAANLEADLSRLTRQSAGLYVDFVTAADTIIASWSIDESYAGSDHPYMTPVAVAGLDLYGMDADGSWKWAGCRGPEESSGGEGALNRSPLDGIKRRYRLYFPLRSRLLSCRIRALRHGSGATVLLPPDDPGTSGNDPARAVCYYGTSIVHGVGVDRPGMAHASQLGRILGREVINLGLAGRARCEPEIAAALNRLDPALFVFDVLPNNAADDIYERVCGFVRLIRAHHASVPVVLIGDREFGDAPFCPERRATRVAKDAELLKAVEALQVEGCPKLYPLLHSSWFGDDCEGTVDASHPNSLGATRFASVLARLLGAILSAERA